MSENSQNANIGKRLTFLPPATKLGQGNIFRSVCPHSVHRGGHAWLLWGGMRGCSGGACMLLWGGACVVALGGACVVALGGCVWLLPGGMHGCSRGGSAWDMIWIQDTVNEHAVRILLECMRVLAPRPLGVFGGHSDSYTNSYGDVHGCSWGVSCMVAPGGAFQWLLYPFWHLCMVTPLGNLCVKRLLPGGNY